MKRLSGRWLDNNLLVTVKAHNGEKTIFVMGKIPPKLKKDIIEYGFEWDQTNRWWSRTVSKTMRIPDFLDKEK